MAEAFKITLFENRTTDGTSPDVRWERPNKAATVTGKGQVEVTGTWGGATVAFFSIVNGEAVPITRSGTTALTMTTAEMFQINIPAGEEQRCVISGATGTTDLTVQIAECRC